MYTMLNLWVDIQKNISSTNSSFPFYKCLKQHKHTRILSRPWNHLFRLPLSRASSPSLEINSIELFLSWHLRLRLVPWYDTCAYFPNITVPRPMAVDSLHFKETNSSGRLSGIRVGLDFWANVKGCSNYSNSNLLWKLIYKLHLANL